MKKITLLLAMMLVSTFTWAQYCAGGPTSTADSNVQQVDLVGATTNISHTGCPGVTGAEKDAIIEGLRKDDGTVVRLYSGTNAKGETRFYEIKDKAGSKMDVTVDRAGSEYQF